MNRLNININTKQKRILLSPLDWGLGHAARCIPIVHELLKQGARVYIACEGATKTMLQQEFPSANFLIIPGYNIEYATRKNLFMFRILAQLPKINKAILQENKWVKKKVQELKIDGVISDNRLGFRYKKKPSVIITHQLQILTGSKFLNRIALRCNYFFLNKFNRCWVPDYEAETSIAGLLSHPKKLPSIPVEYIGTLSRFKITPAPKLYEIMIMLSGPEPMRTILEKKIAEELKDLNKSAILLRGLPASQEKLVINEHTTIYNHCGTKDLQDYLAESKIVICRSGYSSVMDLFQMKKDACLIPTPGQTEQEYLAEHLSAKGFFPFLTEEEFTIDKAIKAVESYSFNKREIKGGNLSNAVSEFIARL